MDIMEISLTVAFKHIPGSDTNAIVGYTMLLFCFHCSIWRENPY